MLQLGYLVWAQPSPPGGSCPVWGGATRTTKRKTSRVKGGHGAVGARTTGMWPALSKHHRRQRKPHPKSHRTYGSTTSFEPSESASKGPKSHPPETDTCHQAPTDVHSNAEEVHTKSHGKFVRHLSLITVSTVHVPIL